MWISEKIYDWTVAGLTEAQKETTRARSNEAAALAKLVTVEADNARLRADMDWFKLRLNQVERERGQLIQAAIGVKVAVPEFVPTYEDPGRALSEMPDLSTVGGDAVDQGEHTEAEPGEGVDYSLLPGYGKR